MMEERRTPVCFDAIAADPEEKQIQPFFDWDWQRFLFGFSFERGPNGYVALNIGFLCLFLAKERWGPWFN